VQEGGEAGPEASASSLMLVQRSPKLSYCSSHPFHPFPQVYLRASSSFFCVASRLSDNHSVFIELDSLWVVVLYDYET
jgi:hypothetical protein